MLSCCCECLRFFLTGMWGLQLFQIIFFVFEEENIVKDSEDELEEETEFGVNEPKEKIVQELEEPHEWGKFLHTREKVGFFTIDLQLL